MRLIDCERGDVPAVEAPEEARLHQSLGSEVEETEVAAVETFERLLQAVRRQRRVDERCRNTTSAQEVDLILHQRDQRRNDDCEAGPHERRQLVAERLTAAGRHQREHVAAS